jgi:hypothetical protein
VKKEDGGRGRVANYLNGRTFGHCFNLYIEAVVVRTVVGAVSARKTYRARPGRWTRTIAGLPKGLAR